MILFVFKYYELFLSHFKIIQLLTGLLAKILKENNILQVQINAEHLRKRYKRVLYRKKKNADGHNKRISSYFETF